MQKVSDDEKTYIYLTAYLCTATVGRDQSHYIKVSQGAFFVEQKWRSGLVLGQLAVLKKKWADYEQLLRAVFSCFREQYVYFFYFFGFK